jgi:hypothetical protein
MNPDVGISPKSILCGKNPFPNSECLGKLCGNHSHIYFVYLITDGAVRFTEWVHKSG